MFQPCTICSIICFVPFEIIVKRARLTLSTKLCVFNHPIKLQWLLILNVNQTNRVPSPLSSEIGSVAFLIAVSSCFLKAKVALSCGKLIERRGLEKMSTFGEMIRELTLRWKISRNDVDLLEQLLGKIDASPRSLDEFKRATRYDLLTSSSERDVTTLISTLHGALRGCEEEEEKEQRTTACLLHHGDHSSFNRMRITCVKEELAILLNIDFYQVRSCGSSFPLPPAARADHFESPFLNATSSVDTFSVSKTF